MSEETTKVKIPTPFGPVEMNGKKTAEFISILSLCGLLMVGYALWDHKAEASEGFNGVNAQLEKNQATQTSNMKELSNAIREQTKAQKFQTCILSMPVADREREYNNPNGLCARLTR